MAITTVAPGINLGQFAERAQYSGRPVVATEVQTATQQQIESSARKMEQISLAFDRQLKFVVDHESHEVTVKVIDPETDKVIKVLPPEELQRLHSKIQETIGFLFDEQV
jgi:flagellar protein FlaG